MNSSLPRLLSAICLVCLASIARAEERTSAIRDDAGLFKAKAIAEAERQIDDIHRTQDRNLFVDTVKSAPLNERRWFHFQTARQVNRILEELAQKRANESGIEGIYVVICTNPKDVHVVVRPADDTTFTSHDAEELRRTIARQLRDGNSDRVLLALVDRVRATLQANAARSRSASIADEFVFPVLLAGGVGLWILLSAVRFRMRRRRSIGEREEDSAERSARMPALLGAMFGSPAGQWLYDKLAPRAVRMAEPETAVAPTGEVVQSPTVEESPEDAAVMP